VRDRTLDGLGGRVRSLDAVAVDVPPRLQDYDRTAQRARKRDLGQRSPASAYGNHGLARRRHREISRVADPADDHVVDPLPGRLVAFTREDPDGRAARPLRASGRCGHDLSAAAGHDRASAFGEQAAHLLGGTLVLDAASDHRYLRRHVRDATRVADELARIHGFEHAVEMAGTEKVASPLGHGVLTRELPRRHDSNFLFLDCAQTATEAIAEADRILGGAGRSHRVMVTFNDEVGERLRPNFDALGWRTQRHIFMVQRRESEKTADLSVVREVDQAALRPGRKRLILAEPWGDPDLAEQILDSKILIGEHADTRFFGVAVEGEIVAWTDLYLGRDIAQVEDVATLEKHRGKGYATAVVLRAIEVARQQGADLVYLVADDEDWPKEWYRRLGFDVVGRIYKFIAP
jgi:ribosomal protein S18 acetylase RimI-like enzyme